MIGWARKGRSEIINNAIFVIRLKIDRGFGGNEVTMEHHKHLVVFYPPTFFYRPNIVTMAANNTADEPAAAHDEENLDDEQKEEYKEMLENLGEFAVRRHQRPIIPSLVCVNRPADTEMSLVSHTANLLLPK